MLTGIAILTMFTEDFGFAAAKPYAHDFSGMSVPETAPPETLPPPTTTVTAAAVTTAAVTTATVTTSTETTVPLPETTVSEVSYPLDLNAATLEALCTLPEIGKVTALAILDHRERIGGFTNRRQLRDVPGIGEKRYLAIYDLVCIENEQPLPDEVPTEAPVPDITVSGTDAPEAELPAPETAPPAVPFININAASLDDLMQLPGCDEATAQAILRLRNDLGMFHSTLELLIVISDSQFHQWEASLAVDDAGNTQLYDETLPAE